MSKKNQEQGFKDLSSEKINEKISFLKKELFNLRFQKTLGELTNTSTFSKVKKDIARAQTELSFRKLNRGEK